MLDHAETRSEISALEQLYIRWYRELGLSYNLTDGGEGGLVNITEETRAKLRGRPSANKGKKASPELRAKLSAAHMGQTRGPMSEEHKQKLAEGISGAWTPERKAAFAESKRGNKNFEGRSHSEEAKQKIADAHKGDKNGMFGKPTSDAQKAAASAAWKGKSRAPFTEEHKQKIREARAKQDMSSRRKEQNVSH